MTPKHVTWRTLKYHWSVYWFILPVLVLVALFQYLPATSGIFHSFFRWNGADVSEPVGWGNYLDLIKTPDFWRSFKVAFILGAWNIIKMIPPLAVAVCIHRCSSARAQFLYRCLFVVPMVMPGLIIALIWRTFFFESTVGYLNEFLIHSGLFDVLCSLDRFFGWDVFHAGIPPNWLGDPNLLLTSIVLWGFPWVGSFAVLTYLAKLQSIDRQIYEAADIDGASWWSKFTQIELPLISGSIYLLLVFTIIDTIKDAGAILIIVGMEGGPGGALQVPALFMLRKAFMDNQMGYACAVGIVLTLIVMSMQKISTLAVSWNELAERRKRTVKYVTALLSLAAIYYGFLLPVALGLIVMMIPWRNLANGLAALVRGKPKPFDWAAWAVRQSQLADLRLTPAYRLRERLGALVLRTAKHGVIWLVLALAFLPVYLMIIVSLKTNAQFFAAPANLTEPYHWSNWASAWHQVAPSIANSLYLSISTTFISLALAIGGAYFFARMRMPFSGFLWNALLVLMMMPSIANLIPLFRLLGDLNLINTLSALILVGVSSGQVYSIFVLRTFVADLPQDLFEAAEIDGASHFQQLKTIVVPLSGTIMGTIGVTLFISQWNDFVLPLIVMRDQSRLPVMVAMQRMAGEYIKEMGPLMAGYAIVSIPVIVLFIFSMKLFIKGMMEGATKG